MDPELAELLQLYRAAGIEPPAEKFGGVPGAQLRAAIDDTPVFYRAAKLLRAADDADPDALTRTYVASAQAVDRAGDLVQIRASRKPIEFRGKTIKPQGLQTANFKNAGAPLLWAHNRKQDLPPVGFISKFTPSTVFDPVQGKNVPAMLETAQFTPHDDFELSKTVAYLATVTKSLNTVSIGFVPEVGIWVEDAKERERLGLGPWGQHFLQSDQIELSMTPTPMLPLAVGVEGKSWHDLLDADVARGMKELVERGVISKAVHDNVLPMLVPIDGDTRARARIRGFVEFRSAKAEDGSWGACPPTYEPLIDGEEKTVEACAARFAQTPTAPPEPEGAEERSAGDDIDGEGGDSPEGVVAPYADGGDWRRRAEQAETALNDVRRAVIGDEGGCETIALLVARADRHRKQWATRGALIERVAEALQITGSQPQAFVDAIQRLRDAASAGGEPQATAREAGSTIYAGDCARIEAAIETIANGENELAMVLDSIRSRQGVELADAGSTLGADRLARAVEGLTQALAERGVEIEGGANPPRQVPRAARSDDEPKPSDAFGDLVARAQTAINAVSSLDLGDQSPTGA